MRLPKALAWFGKTISVRTVKDSEGFLDAMWQR